MTKINFLSNLIGKYLLNYFEFKATKKIFKIANEFTREQERSLEELVEQGEILDSGPSNIPETAYFGKYIRPYLNPDLTQEETRQIENIYPPDRTVPSKIVEIASAGIKKFEEVEKELLLELQQRYENPSVPAIIKLGWKINDFIFGISDYLSTGGRAVRVDHSMEDIFIQGSAEYCTSLRDIIRDKKYDYARHILDYYSILHIKNSFTKREFLKCQETK